MRPNRIVLLALAIAALTTPVRGQDTGQTGPVELTREQDHQRTMMLLNMPTIRRGASGSDTTSIYYANYIEEKANPYPNLPDPLLTNDRRVVSTPEMWWDIRRPEIVEYFDREIYGRVPENTPGVDWEVVNATDTTIGAYPVIVKRLTGHVDNSSYPQISVEIDVVLTTPADAAGPVPVITQFGFTRFRRPPGAAQAPPRAPGAAQAPPRPPGPPPGPVGPSWQEQLLEKGWGYAILNPGSVQADNGAGLTTGIIGLVNKGQPRGLEDWGSLRAWAWGASRLLDYFETDDAVDAKQVGLQGHSRYGKATVVAMAYDERFAIAFISSSGEGGVKLHRRNWGEIVENVAGTGEYHWMAGNFIKYAGLLTWGDLPVDSHELIALCAPRPVFISSGDRGDYWVDAKGMFLAGAHAGPVYELLGKKGLGTLAFPPVETGLMDGDISFRQHSSGHTPGPNWPFFTAFAERYLTTR